ncbi:MAG TPA: hypothetical protein VGE98_06005 [Thermoanaerobaculia bacterium]
MISNDGNDPQAAQPSGGVAPLNPGSIIEVASTGNGTVIDTSGQDTKPPGNDDSDPLSQLLG